MNIDTVATVLALLNNPFIQLGGAALLAIAGALAAYAIRTQPQARDIAQDLADLAEEIEPWVVEVEKLLKPGSVKYALVLDQAEAWLAERGIVGARGRLVKKYLPGFIEAAVRKVDPKKAA